MSTCVIFGGTGYIGSHLVEHFTRRRRFEKIWVIDIIAPKQVLTDANQYLPWDVRRPIPKDLIPDRPEWIFNLSAVHREPGHAYRDYFETNLLGAYNITAYADEVSCRSIFFTSSISVYGPVAEPTDEHCLPTPTTPYGASKLAAELIHEKWANKSQDKRLIIARPGVVYGPRDAGNILRMVKAVKKGYFIFPGSTRIHKSYGYIFGLLDSVDFMMRGDDHVVKYNYVETPTQTLGEIVNATKAFFGTRAPVISLPAVFLMPAAHIAAFFFREKTALHPARVRKAATPTHIVPRVLLDRNFPFVYTFSKSLEHWQERNPEDFC